MKLRSQHFLMLSLTSVLFSGFLTPALAVQLDTLLAPAKNTAEAFYKIVDIVYIEYPNGGKVKSELENVNDQMSFTANKNTPGVQELIDKINQKLVKERKSPAIIEDLKIDYRATLEGEGDRAVLERLLKLNAIVTNFVINVGSAEEGTLIDLNWRGFKLDEPAVIKTQEFGDVDINFASGYFYARQPETMKILENSDAVKVLNKPSIDFTEFTDLTLDKWHWSFDPTGSIKESENFGFTETGGAKVITFFALGEGSIREGIKRETITEADATVDGDKYKVRNTTPPSAASIQILGYATQSIQGSDEGAVVFESTPEGGTGKSYAGGFPITVLMVMGGMLGAIAGFVLWRANKK